MLTKASVFPQSRTPIPILLLCLAACQDEPRRALVDTTPKSSFQVTVLDASTESPIEKAFVLLFSVSLDTQYAYGQVDIRGRFQTPVLPEGRVGLRVFGLGYCPAVDTLTVPAPAGGYVVHLKWHDPPQASCR